MELELKKRSQVFYDMTSRKTGAHEQTCEAIVSDSQPDILRIAGVTGQVYCTSPVSSSKGAELSGVVRAAVLYIPEDGGGVCFIPVSMNFTHALELPQRGSERDAAGVMLGGAELTSLEAKTVNPRKVLLRAELKLWAERAERVELEFCAGFEGAHSLGVELLRENYAARLMCAAGKRAFSIEDSIELPAGRPAARELIAARATFSPGDYNIIGRRVVFKGAMSADILYRTASGDTASFTAAVPFSQIAELDDLEEGAECVIRIMPASAEFTLVQNGEGRLFEVTAGGEAQIECYTERRLEAITDLYSTSMQAAVDIRPCTFTALRERSSRRATVRDSADAPQQVRETRGMEVSLGPMRLTRGENGALAFTGEAEARVAYMGEDNELCQLRRRVPVSLDAGELNVDFDRGDAVLADVRAENLAASPSASNGAELRFDVVCDLMLLHPTTISSVEKAQLEPVSADAAPRPSVVLRMPESGETLWSIAKRYGSAVSELCAANGLEGKGALDPAPDGRMLLIPKRR